MDSTRQPGAILPIVNVNDTQVLAFICRLECMGHALRYTSYLSTHPVLTIYRLVAKLHSGSDP
jgi:hypothetical protein